MDVAICAAILREAQTGSVEAPAIATAITWAGSAWPGLAQKAAAETAIDADSSASCASAHNVLDILPFSSASSSPG